MRLILSAVCLFLSISAFAQHSREVAVRLWFDSYLTTATTPTGQWTGDFMTCNPGTMLPEYSTKMLGRLNFFRAMAGIPANVVNDPVRAQGALEAALMMGKAGALSHTPGTTWPCYTAAGATSAGRSNLYGGPEGSNAIDGFMLDPGVTSLGHRRYFLKPDFIRTGLGSVQLKPGGVNAAAAVDVFGYGSRPSTPKFVSWPPPGHVPYSIVWGAWNFAPNRSGVTMTSATITMTKNGVPLPVTKLIPENANFQLPDYGDRAIGWIPSDFANMSQGAPKPSASEAVYNVTINGVMFGGTVQPAFQYEVRVFDPQLYQHCGAMLMTNDVTSASVDFTNDGKINFDDLLVLAQGYGTTYGFDQLLNLAQRYNTCYAKQPVGGAIQSNVLNESSGRTQKLSKPSSLPPPPSPALPSITRSTGIAR